MKRRGPRTKWQRIIRETVLEILIGAAIGLAFDAMLFMDCTVDIQRDWMQQVRQSDSRRTKENLQQAKH